ncbi:Endoribonuclease L-PSP [Croceitalea dokdonensis DOKDO 023]|uniref:Endoribonuclease L-PSP n=1 Tax=Croceitalea dokdonensis DOKDO 023 TaxID=1300341 RepID=A0A0P7AWK5_9FLAO|nr:RidA family protein [Croceitalea dokdonensis]KPM33096.1 Endoribonuclease L-PSP [Croceitalea dokdonensis DOKDO 023]
MDSIEGKVIPQGNYKPAVRHGTIIYTAGMTPRKGGILQFKGKILLDTPIETYKNAVVLATTNALSAANGCLQGHEHIDVILQLNVYLNAEQGFEKHAQVADYASNFLKGQLGIQCIGTRAAIGVATLPSNAAVEITMVASVK